MPKTQTFDRDGNLVSESEEYQIPAGLPTPAGSRQWPPSEFLMRLLTQTEVNLIDASAVPAVRMVRLRFLAATDPIDLDSPELDAALDVLVANLMITDIRKASILAGQPVE